MYNSNINPKLYRRPLNVKVGGEFYYIPDNAIATDAIPKGEVVEIIQCMSIRERGKAIVKVKAKNGEHNVLLEHLAVIF